jgi:hypothetical protein
MAKCLLAIHEDLGEEVGKGSAVGPADDARRSEVGIVMQGWDMEDDEEYRRHGHGRQRLHLSQERPQAELYTRRARRRKIRRITRGYTRHTA